MRLEQVFNIGPGVIRPGLEDVHHPVGQKISRRYVVHQDVVPAYLVGQAFGEGHRAHACNSGRHQVIDGLVHGTGQDVDYPAPSPFFHMGDRFTAHSDEKHEGHVDALTPYIFGGVRGPACRRASRVVYQDVQPSKVVDSSFNQSLDIRQLAKVTGNSQHLDPRRFADLPGGLAQFLGVPATDHEVRAFLGQGIGAGPAQSLAAAADYRHSAFQSQVHHRLLPRAPTCYQPGLQ